MNSFNNKQENNNTTSSNNDDDNLSENDINQIEQSVLNQISKLNRSIVYNPFIDDELTRIKIQLLQLFISSVLLEQDSDCNENSINRPKKNIHNKSFKQNVNGWLDKKLLFEVETFKVEGVKHNKKQNTPRNVLGMRRFCFSFFGKTNTVKFMDTLADEFEPKTPIKP